MLKVYYLTKNQLEILELLAEGYTQIEAAHKLYKAIGNLGNTLSLIKKKTGAKTTKEVIQLYNQGKFTEKIYRTEKPADNSKYIKRRSLREVLLPEIENITGG